MLKTDACKLFHKFRQTFLSTISVHSFIGLTEKSQEIEDKEYCGVSNAPYFTTFQVDISPFIGKITFEQKKAPI